MATTLTSAARPRVGPSRSPRSVRGEPWATRAPVHDMAEAGVETRTEAGDIFNILGANKGLILFVTLLFVAAAAAYGVLMPKVYKATAAIVIDVRGRPTASEPDQPLNGSPEDIGLIEKQVQLIRSPPVLRRVVTALKLEADPEFNGTEPAPLSKIMGLLGLASSDTIPSDPVTKAINSLAGALTLRRSEHSYVVEIDVQSRGPERAKQLADAVAQAYLKAKEAHVSGPSAIVVRILQMATVPISPAAPKKGGALAIGLCMGAFVGVLVALLRNVMSSPPRTAALADGARAKLTRDAASPTILTDLPLKGPMGRRHAAALRPEDGPRAYASDANFRANVAELLHVMGLPSKRSRLPARVLITSLSPGTGKTLLAFTLAQMAAEQGLATVLVEGNTDDPMLDALVLRTSQPGILGLVEDGHAQHKRHRHRVGYLLDFDTRADLCVVPIVANEASLLCQLSRQSDGRPLMAEANLVIYDGGVISNPDVVDLAHEAHHVIVVVGPSERATLRWQNPVCDLGIAPGQWRGFVGSPVDGLSSERA